MMELVFKRETNHLLHRKARKSCNLRLSPISASSKIRMARIPSLRRMLRRLMILATAIFFEMSSIISLNSKLCI